MSHSPSSNSTLDQSKRDQGGKLDLHADAGLLALREAGLLTEFEKHARPDGDALKLVSPTGKVLWDENSIPATVPERELNAEIAVQKSTVWCCAISSLERSGMNAYGGEETTIRRVGRRRDLQFALRRQR